jgi:cell division protein FtsQ
MQPPDDTLDVVDGDMLDVVDGDMLDVVDGDLDDNVIVLAEPVLDGETLDVVDGDDVEVLEVLDGADAAVARPQTGAPRRPPVDPRIRARRIAVAREQGRRRLRVVLVLLSVIVVVGSAWLVVQSPFLNVDRIVVTGVPGDRVAAIVAASGVHRHDPLLLVSTGAVTRRVERVPGVGSVHVSRHFPGTLRISVRELGVALWARAPAGGVVLIGHDGRVQRHAPVPPPNVVELRGVTHVPTPGGRLVSPSIVAVRSQLPPAMFARVGAISAATATDVRLYLVTGGEVRLGDLSSLHDKAVAAEAVIERMGCALVYVDVRSLSNPVALAAPGAVCNP